MSAAQHSAPAFDGIAPQYDEIFTRSLIGRAQRNAVWAIVHRHFAAGDRVLELNCGTGEDALFLSARRMSVIACDISPAMIHIARAKAARCQSTSVDFRVLAIEHLDALGNTGRFDAVFSNFSGLNCVDDLASVARTLAQLTTPRAKAILCLTNKYCFSEMIWYSLHGQFRRAFRRLTSNGTTARIGEGSVHVRYPRVSTIANAFAPHFRLIGIHGVGITVPPSYLEPWARSFPQALSVVAAVDRTINGWPLFRVLGDHVVLVLEKTA